MGKYDNSADMAIQLIYKFIEERRKEKNISQLELANLIGINESTLIRNLKGESAMTLSTLMKICGALELRPFFIPAELDESEYQRVFFN